MRKVRDNKEKHEKENRSQLQLVLLQLILEKFTIKEGGRGGKEI